MGSSLEEVEKLLRETRELLEQERRRREEAERAAAAARETLRAAEALLDRIRRGGDQPARGGL